MSDPTENTVRYNVKMPEQLREDAKDGSKRGELSQEVRDLFRRKAYGADASQEFNELEQKKAELRSVREDIDSLRHDRTKIATEIEAKENRAVRLEEQIERLEKSTSQLETQLEMLENMLHGGEYMWPVRIKNAADVDSSTAEKLHQELKTRNPDIPQVAFKEPSVHRPNDWTEIDDDY